MAEQHDYLLILHLKMSPWYVHMHEANDLHEMVYMKQVFTMEH